MPEPELAPATLLIDGKELSLPRTAAVEGNDGIAIPKLLAETGVVTIDPGFGNTAACHSTITYIDGAEGILRYRGYPIEQLAKHSCFLEVSYLLIHGELPSAAELAEFEANIERNRELPEAFNTFLAALPAQGHPMAILQAAVSALGTFYRDTLNPVSADERNEAATILLAKIPTLVAALAQKGAGRPTVAPVAGQSYVESFLAMAFGEGGEASEVSPVLVKTMDMLLTLHADHEQNCSTSTVRGVASAEADIYASVSAGIGALSGPAHGGANEAVVNMLTEIHETGVSVEDFMARVKDRSSGSRLMGFGHRVYKNYDPRAAIVKKAAHEVFAELGVSDPLLDIALKLEEIALNDEYFISRKLYPNVDFYTGLIYKAMGFDPLMFTPLFVLGRMPGWIAQFNELVTDPATKIVRPRQIYTGEAARDYPGGA